MYHGQRLGYDDATWTAVLRKTVRRYDRERDIDVYQCTVAKDFGSTYCRGAQFAEAHKGFDNEKQGYFPSGKGGPRRWIRKGYKSCINLDHSESYDLHIRGRGGPNDSGEITSRDARVAYNDVGNLVPMCNRCNSRKGGRRVS
jgi:hypothetical protein